MSKHKAYTKKNKKQYFRKKKKKRDDSFKAIISQSLKQANIWGENHSTLSLVGNKSLYIENYHTIVEYNTSYIKIKIKDFILVVEGQKLDVQYFTDEDLMIKGSIHSITYI